jgi:hypothetical protein
MDIFPNMKSTGQWKCGSSACHGGATAPPIADDDAIGAYIALATHVGTYANPYIVPCDGDPTHSSILCNLTLTGCGAPMPIGPGAPLTASDLATIRAWVECGSPPN